MPTFVRYALIQLPGLLALVVGLVVARRFIELSTGVIALLAAAWIVKDLALYPLLRRAYEVDARTEMERLQGGEATVSEPLAPLGLVSMRGELWRAEAAPGEPLPLVSGSRVRIEGHRGLVLVVRRARDSQG